VFLLKKTKKHCTNNVEEPYRLIEEKYQAINLCIVDSTSRKLTIYKEPEIPFVKEGVLRVFRVLIFRTLLKCPRSYWVFNSKGRHILKMQLQICM